jgi:hypothetical protein
VINPFPLDRARQHGRPGAHHNPMENYPDQCSGCYRLRLPSRIPKAVSDDEFNAIFAKLPSNRETGPWSRSTCPRGRIGYRWAVAEARTAALS